MCDKSNALLFTNSTNVYRFHFQNPTKSGLSSTFVRSVINSRIALHSECSRRLGYLLANYFARLVNYVGDDVLQVSIGYLPDKRVIGLSKLAR